MATITFKNGDDYLFKLSKLEAASRDEICGGAIYAGAAIVTDAIRSELEALPTDEGFGTPEKPLKGLKTVQKEDLLKSLGIASMKDDGTGFLNVKIGFDGYNRLTTKKWPRGQPNQMIARAAESGTTFLLKNEFVKRAARKSRKKALAIMEKKVQEGIEKIMK